MDTNIKEKRLRRRDVKKGVRRGWLAMKGHLGAEAFYALLFVEQGVSTSTARNAVEAGSATADTEEKITAFCNAHKKREHGTEETPVKLGRK